MAQRAVRQRACVRNTRACPSEWSTADGAVSRSGRAIRDLLDALATSRVATVQAEQPHVPVDTGHLKIRAGEPTLSMCLH